MRGIGIVVVLLGVLAVAFGCTRYEPAEEETQAGMKDEGTGGMKSPGPDGGGPSTATADKELALTADNDGETITLKVGQEFTIALKSNPSTGYGWEAIPLPEPVVEQVGEATYTPDENSDRRVGVGGTSTFRFKAVAAGKGPLKLVYRRPWERNVAPATSFSVKLVVEE